MSVNGPPDRWFTQKAVQEELENAPHILLRLAENALTVAESVRDNYVRNTAQFVGDLRKRLIGPDPVISVRQVGDVGWSRLQGEVVTFIDGGVGQVQVSTRVPILIRVGSYSVKTGERRLSERENFGYYPIILGDLEGGTKSRPDFIDIVRITAELLGGLSALERTPNLRVLMFHGPLVYLVGTYVGHTPFTENDIDLFLRHYTNDVEEGRRIKEEFLHEASLDIYPRMAPGRADEWIRRRVFEPLAWMAFLYRRLIRIASSREPRPIIAGVVERGRLTDFSEHVLLPRIFRRLREKGNADYFNRLFGRNDLTSPEAVLERLGYTDALLLQMLMHPGELSEPWLMARKFGGLRKGTLRLPGEGFSTPADWSHLRPPNEHGFPEVSGRYLQVSPTTEPVRIEVFAALGDEQLIEAAQRAYLYARLLPGYGFPVGIDIVDKYARVPAWLTDAYGKMIRFHLSASLQRGEITDAEMRRILVQAIYMTNRDWLLRPDA
jgi:hypothetical protein